MTETDEEIIADVDKMLTDIKNSKPTGDINILIGGVWFTKKVKEEDEKA